MKSAAGPRRPRGSRRSPPPRGAEPNMEARPRRKPHGKPAPRCRRQPRRLPAHSPAGRRCPARPPPHTRPAGTHTRRRGELSAAAEPGASPRREPQGSRPGRMDPEPMSLPHSPHARQCRNRRAEAAPAPGAGTGTHPLTREPSRSRGRRRVSGAVPRASEREEKPKWVCRRRRHHGPARRSPPHAPPRGAAPGPLT